ncbi:MAG: class I SAM-dependent methyltransferase [Pseudomonadota bacterium]
MTEGKWRENSAVFHEMAAEYDSWFEDSLLFDIELTALRELQTPLHGPKLEVGVGPGRFAAALDVAFGIDPARAPLKLSSRRGIHVAQAIGEEMPFGDCAVATVYLLFTLCFLADPLRVIGECYRILKPHGHLVLGMVPAGGAWGRALQAKKERNHPFYRHAAFYKGEQVGQWLREVGFFITEQRSSLFQEPGELKEIEHSRAGLDEKAGFWLLVGRK